MWREWVLFFYYIHAKGFYKAAKRDVSRPLGDVKRRKIHRRLFFSQCVHANDLLIAFWGGVALNVS